MRRLCEDCGEFYDDVDRSTICDHELIMPLADLEQKKLAIALMGKEVRFAHQEQGPLFRIQSIGWNGMLTLEGVSGEFAPHLFMADEALIAEMLGPDLALAAVARRIFDKRHAGDPQPREPRHCSECFEGCPKCSR